MRVSSHIGVNAVTAYVAMRNRAFDAVRFTTQAPDLPMFAAHCVTFTPHNADLPNSGGDVSDRAIFAGNDREAVEVAAMAHPATERVLYRNRDDLQFIGLVEVSA